MIRHSVIFDVGRVLFDWDLRYLFARLIADNGVRSWWEAIEIKSVLSFSLWISTLISRKISIAPAGGSCCRLLPICLGS